MICSEGQTFAISSLNWQHAECNLHLLLFPKSSFYTLTWRLTIMPTSLMLWLSGSLDGEEDEAKEWEYWALHRTLQVSSISWISQVSSRHPLYIRAIHTPIWAQQSTFCLFSKQINRKYLEGIFIDNNLYYRAEETYGREEVWMLWQGSHLFF